MRSIAGLQWREPLQTVPAVNKRKPLLSEAKTEVHSIIYPHKFPFNDDEEHKFLIRSFSGDSKKSGGSSVYIGSTY